jgi:hypothetical protein
MATSLSEELTLMPPMANKRVLVGKLTNSKVLVPPICACNFAVKLKNMHIKKVVKTLCIKKH